MAVTDLGLSPEYFWGLTWYEWGLYVLRLIKENKRSLEQREFTMELTGQFMALLANVNRDSKKKPSPFKREDFFRLSYDTQLTHEADPELFGRVARRLGSEIKKKKDSGNE